MDQSLTQPEARLMAHVDCNKVTRQELEAIPTPQGTDTFKPVSHIELVAGIQAILSRKGIEIVKEQFAVRADGSRLFGTFDLSLNGLEGSCASLGFRTANDRTMKISIVAGMSVFVCDNMVLSGDSVILNRKHTSGLDLIPELEGAVERYQVRYSSLREQVANMARLVISDSEAKVLIHDTFVAEVMPIRYLPDVSREYFEPKHPEFEPRTTWSLHNAFTEVMKGMTLNRRMLATQGLGRVFGLLA